jgi:flagellar basal body-associated protein FliL
MSERSDRSIPGRGPLVITIMAIALIVAGGGGYLWFRMAGAPQAEPTGQQEEQTSAPATRPDDPFLATLFVPGDGDLGTVVVPVRRRPDVQLQAREAVAALLADDQGRQSSVLKELRLRAFYLDATGTATVDLSAASPNQKEIRASAEDELLAVYAMVNTLTQNFPEVRQVRFLMDGREAQTLAGHIDLSRAYVKRTDMVKTSN